MTALPLDLSILNPQQQEAVTAPEARVLVLAGPGTGKTVVLLARMAWLLQQATASPSQTAALTFSQKAGQELRRRLRAVLGGDAGVYAGTFHAFALRQLGRHGQAFGIQRRPVVYASEAERKGALARALREMGEDPQAWDLDLTLSLISLARRRLLRPRDLEREDPRLARAFRAYQAVMRRAGAIDFDAMLLLLHLLLVERPEGETVRNEARHLLLDEAQDLEECQWALVSELLPVTLYVVGDPLQAIYAWRGADPAYLSAMARTARVVDLGVSYRCPAPVLEAAGALVQGLPFGERLLKPAHPQGPPIVVYQARDPEEEAAFVAREIRRLLREGIVASPSRTAVLFRANHQAREIESALVMARLPYQVRGDFDLFASREVRETVAMLRLALDPSDVRALELALGARAFQLEALARRLRYGDEITLPELRQLYPCGLGDPQRQQALYHFLSAVDQLSRAASDGSTPPARLLRAASAACGYDPGRAPPALAALLRLADGLGAQDPWALLEELALMTSEAQRGDEDGVALMTIHAAKGLEWDAVFVVGLTADLLPHRRSLEEKGEEALAEERRLLYVAMTRTRERLYLLSHRYRQTGDRVVATSPSPFLRYLPPHLLEVRRGL